MPSNVPLGCRARQALSWLAIALLLATGLAGCLAVAADPKDGIVEAFFALVPVLAALPVSLVAYVSLRFWQVPAGTWWGTFSGALLTGTLLLWLVPALAAADYRLLAEYVRQPLTLPLLWLNFATPTAFWPLFWLGNGVGAGLGYVASRRAQATGLEGR